MIRQFHDQATADIFNGRNTAAARRRLPRALWAVAQRKLDMLNAATRLEGLRVPPANRLEALRGSRQGQYSIRINERYRICFVWTPEGPTEVEITDYHR